MVETYVYFNDQGCINSELHKEQGPLCVIATGAGFHDMYFVKHQHSSPLYVNYSGVLSAGGKLLTAGDEKHKIKWGRSNDILGSLDLDLSFSV